MVCGLSGAAGRFDNPVVPAVKPGLRLAHHPKALPGEGRVTAPYPAGRAIAPSISSRHSVASGRSKAHDPIDDALVGLVGAGIILLGPRSLAARTYPSMRMSMPMVQVGIMGVPMHQRRMRSEARRVGKECVRTCK